MRCALNTGDTIFATRIVELRVRALGVGKRRVRLVGSTSRRYRSDYRRCLEDVLELEPQLPDEVGLGKRCENSRGSLALFVTDRGVANTKHATQHTVRTRVMFRGVTNGSDSNCGPQVFDAVR